MIAAVEVPRVIVVIVLVVVITSIVAVVVVVVLVLTDDYDLILILTTAISYTKFTISMRADRQTDIQTMLQRQINR